MLDWQDGPARGNGRAAARGRPSIDERLLLVARTRGHDPRLERLVARFSALGQHGIIWLAIGASGAVLQPQRRASWRRAGGVVAGTYVLNTAVKLVVRRARPTLEDLPALARTPTQLSFPSAHAATSFAGARVYSRLGVPATLVYALAVSLALSRLYLGLHYPSDILAGALLGNAVAAGFGAAPGFAGAPGFDAAPGGPSR